MPTLLAAVLLAMTVFATTPAPATQASRLDAAKTEIERIIGLSGAEVSVVYRPLNAASGGEILIGPDVVYHAASTMKLPVMIELFRQVDAKTISLDDTVNVSNVFHSIVDGSEFTLATSEEVDGAAHRAIGKPMSYRDLCETMITISSNLAANVLMEKLGVEKIRATVTRLKAPGRDYKASFGPDVSEYIPFLGSSAPRNYPVALSLASMRSGGTEIEFEHGVQATRKGDTITFDRGVLREVYDVSLCSVEQSFDIAQRVGDGDLALEIAFQSELTATATKDGISFSNELGRVDCSHAVAIDAAGRHVDLDMQLGARGTLVLTVPDAWLDAATFPVRIDPTFNTYAVASGTLFQHDSDVAFDNTTGRFTVVWESDFSTGDHDVGFADFFSDGTLNVSGFIDNTAGYYGQPRIGHTTSLLRFLTVFTGGFPGFTTAHIWARQTNTDGVLVAPAFQVDVGSMGGSDQPDVGGDNTFDQSHDMCVVWRHQFVGGSTIALQRVTAAGALHGASVDLPTVPGVEHHPRISNAHDGTAWTVVWQRDEGPNSNNLGYARPRIDFSSLPFSYLYGALVDVSSPSLSSFLPGTSRQMIVYEQHNGSDTDIMAALWNDMSLDYSFDLSALDGSDPLNTVEPQVETDGAHYVVSYRDTAANVLYATEFYFTPAPVPIGITNGPVQLASGVNPGANIDSYFSTGGSTFPRKLASVYSQGGDVKVAVLQDAIGGKVFPECFGDGTGLMCPCNNNGSAGHGCGNSVNAAGALLGFSGRPGLGAQDTLVLTGSGMPPSSSCLYFQGTSISTIGSFFGDGARCVTGSVVRLGIKTNDVGGSSQYPGVGDPSVSVRGGLPSYGGLRGYQVWYRNAANYCTSSTFNLSNGLHVEFAP